MLYDTQRPWMHLYNEIKSLKARFFSNQIEYLEFLFNLLHKAGFARQCKLCKSPVTKMITFEF